MDIHQDLIKWFRVMGYTGKIPDNLTGVCNNSTKFVWEQLIQNIRPRQEVETKRRNIILNRLRKKPLEKQDDFVYRVKEIEAYKKRLALEQKLKAMKTLVEEKEYKVDQLSQKCKMKDITLDFLKKNIKENEQRKYLLDTKKDQLEVQKKEAEDALTKLKNITPVEREESSTPRDITETLEKCAEKLNEILVENQKYAAQKLLKSSNPLATVKKQNLHNESSVATFLLRQEKEHFEEITRSCKKQALDHERQDDHKNVKHRLFDTRNIIVEDFDETSLVALPLDDNSDTKSTPSISRPSNRESLGLLPDSCLDEFGNDSFLTAIGTRSSTHDSESVFNKSQDSIFLSDTNSVQHSNNDTDDSVVFNFKVPEKRPVKKSAKSETKRDMYHDAVVTRELKKLLCQNNREMVSEMLQKCIHNVKIEFIKIVSMEKGTVERRNKINEDDIARLKFIHIQTELKILQQKKALKDLIAKIGRKKMQLLSSIRSKEHLTEAQEWMEASIKQVALDASLDALKKEVVSSEVVEYDDNDLQVLFTRIMKIKNEITNNMQLVQLTIKDLDEAHKFLAETRESVLNPIWHVRMMKIDCDWMNPLWDGTWLEEMQVFRNFPLEYQRRCIYTEPKTFYRDMCTDNYPQNTEISPEDLQMLTEILENPFSPPETVLLNVIKAKMKMNVLKTIANKKSNDAFVIPIRKKYSFEELQHQESYLEFAVDRLKSLMFSSNAGRTLAMGDVVRQTMDIWTEMPFKEFICNKRLFEGKPYQYYENRLKSFL